MKPIMIFSGTSEGRKLAEWVGNNRIPSTVSVATSYGELVMEPNEYITVLEGRMDVNQMTEELHAKEYQCVVDATHPFATEVTGHIKEACRRTGLVYLRLTRDMDEVESLSDVIWVNTAKEAAEYLNTEDGNILLTTGSKELEVFADLITDSKRLYARVLPARESMEICKKCGITGAHIIAMQGPFSEELNVAMIKHMQAAYLVTKETGVNGGFKEKIKAAFQCGCKIVIIKNPEKKVETCSFEQILVRLREILSMPIPDKTVQRLISLVGIGMGNKETHTLEAEQVIQKAQIIFGSGRVLESLASHLTYGKVTVPFYQKENIVQYLEAHPEYEDIAVVFSGDIGFCSGACAFANLEKEYTIHYVCGISAVVYFASRLRTTWQDFKLLSAHGKACNIIGQVRKNEKCFLLLPKVDAIRELGKILLSSFGTRITITYGFQLSYPEEKIETGSPERLATLEQEGLYVLLIENPEAAHAVITPGIRDEVFLRDKVPMTKEEVREISLCKLRLTKDAVLYDVGAGTGSVSVECALLCEDGVVYAIEKEQQAVELIEKNRIQFNVTNLEIIQALAPQGLKELPMPTHAFIGGSSGNLEEILNVLLDKNKQIRVVINAITLETISEAMALLEKLPVEDVDIVQVVANKAKKTGRYHLMNAMNPVYIISFNGKE